MTMETGSEFSIGSRIECDGYHGTVRYIGEIPPTKGLWLGIEWDDPSRGKHNGFFEGKQYFTTKHPQSGSFLRPKKASKGVEFLSALEDRYGRTEDGTAGIIEEEMFVRGEGNQQTKIEVVGAESINLKQSEFHRLLDVGLRGQLISEVGDPGAIAKVCPNIQELNVSLNLLSSWKQIADIACQLPRLRSLDVSSNMLEIGDNPKSLCDAFAVLKTIYLNKMSYTWAEIYQCGVMWKNLEELHACFNNIDVISSPLPNLQNLVMLNLEGNPLKDWKNVLELGVLPKLKTMILNDTQLKEIYFSDAPPTGTTLLFPCLESLSINRNEISEWKSVNELNKLRSLKDLKIQNNFMTKVAEDATARSLIIAKIAGLKSANRTVIDKVERKGAEVDYLKMFGLAWKASGGHQDPEKNAPNSQFCDAHPRYQELLNKYGAPEDSELKITTSALKNSLLTVFIDCPKFPEKPAISKKLPRTMTVQKLRALLGRLHKVNGDDIRITYSSKKADSQDFELDNDMREIGFFSIEDEDVIHVNI